MQADDKILQYCLHHTSSAGPVLQALERETYLSTLQPQMMSGPFQGMFLQLVSRMIAPRRVLEIGTFTGYGAICLAQGLQPDGCLHTIEANDERAPLILKYIRLAGLENKISLHIGDATEILPTLTEDFDLVLLDAGKMDYWQHFELALPKTRPGGFLLADNVLWGGKILSDQKDPTAEALRTFNDRIQADPRVENLLLPLRDGLMMIRKV